MDITAILATIAFLLFCFLCRPICELVWNAIFGKED